MRSLAAVVMALIGGFAGGVVLNRDCRYVAHHIWRRRERVEGSQVPAVCHLGMVRRYFNDLAAPRI